MKKTIVIMSFVFITILCIFFANEKEGYYVDEVYSFGLANNSFAPFMRVGESSAPLDQYMYKRVYGETVGETLYNIKDIARDILTNGVRGSEIFQAYKKDIYATYSPKWFSTQDFKDYVAVQEGQRFDFLSVYYNQFRDVHPPFYYILIHFLSSLFPEIVPNTICIVINIVFLLLTLMILYKMVCHFLMNDKLAIAVVLFYGLSLGFLSTSVYMRMYSVLAFFIVASLYVHEKIIFHQFFISGKEIILLIATSFFGFYTQYYFLIYLFFLFLIMIGILLKEKKYKELKWYVLSIVMAGGLSILIWPISLRHLFATTKGLENIEAIYKGQFFANFKEYFQILLQSFFGNEFLLFFVCMMLIIIGCVAGYKKKLIKIEKQDIYIWGIILLPTIIYYVVIVQIANRQTDRYIMCIFPIVALIIIKLMQISYTLLFPKYKNRMLIISLLVVSLYGLIFSSPNYLYKQSNKFKEFQRDTEKKDCIYIYSVWNTYTVMVPYFIENQNNVLILNENDLEFLRKDKKIESGKEFYVYIADTVNEEQVLQNLKENFSNDKIEYKISYESTGVDKDEAIKINIFQWSK